MKVSTKLKDNFLYRTLKFIGLPIILFFRKHKTYKALGLDNKDKFYLPKNTVIGNHKYSVVVAVYRVEKYIEQMLSSLLRQTLDFKHNIEVILVDDGSDDGSSDICKLWATKFPSNIKYFRKENGGQGSARNLGLQYVTGDWVTFIDPDDLVDKNYFLNVDKAITENKNVALVSCNLIYYLEDKILLKASHPLNYKFKSGNRVSFFDEYSIDIQPSSSTAFFRTDLVQKYSIKFPEIRTKGEDLYFVNKFLIKSIVAKAVFLSDSIYWYRKRSDKTSTLDNSWNNEETYSKRLLLYLDLLELAKRSYESVPIWLQHTFIYELSWDAIKFLNNEKETTLVPEKLLDKYIGLVRNILKHIDFDTIVNYKSINLNDSVKLALIGVKDNNYFYYIPPTIKTTGLFKKSTIIKILFTGEIPRIIVFEGSEEIKPLTYDIKNYYFFGKEIFYEYIGVYKHGSHSKLMVKVNENTNNKV